MPNYQLARGLLAALVLLGAGLSVWRRVARSPLLAPATPRGVGPVALEGVPILSSARSLAAKGRWMCQAVAL